MRLERVIMLLGALLLVAGVLVWVSRGAHTPPLLTAWLWLPAVAVSCLPLLLWLLDRISRRR